MNINKSTANLQDVLLNKVKKEEIPITLFLTNGFQIRGLLKGFDSYVLFIEVDGKIQMIYKHAVSTVLPVKSIELQFD